MPLVHLLTSGPDLRQCTVVCGARLPERGTWHRALVTCSRCLAPPRSHVSQGTRAERELQELVRQACGLGHWLYYHTHRSQHSPAGFPDVVALKGPRMIVAELKRTGQAPTPAQAAWLEAFTGVRSVEVYLWTPDDLDQAVEVLR